MPIKTLMGLASMLSALGLAFVILPWSDIASWATLQQRDFQNAMAASLHNIKAGESAAIVSLCLATAAYGFVHALGPGHGKILLGGAAIASGATLLRMILLSLAASLAQAVSAIVIVVILLQVAQIATRDTVGFTEAWLAPLSYTAIAAIGAILMIRGVKGLRLVLSVNKRESRTCGCGHKHGVSLSEVKSLQSLRDVAALIGSIAIRPCTGALFLLVIAARFDIFLVGVLATLTMGMGTAAFNILAATSGVAARRLAYSGTMISGAGLQSLSASLHIAGGLLVFGSSFVLLLSSVP